MTIPEHLLERIGAAVESADADLAARYPGDRIDRQPVHTAYVAADNADRDVVARWGADASEILEANGGVLAELGDESLLPKVRAVLARNPIQDLRLDFEDGYHGTDVDGDAARAGSLLAGLDGPISCGIRINGLTRADFGRSLRTLELVLDGAGGAPPGFVFTVPKFRSIQQVSAAVQLCQALELAHGVPDGTLRFELQIESPQAVVAADGTVAVARAIHEAQGRCSGLHYGTYDYSGAIGIAPAYQALDHPAADHAKSVMLVAAAQTGVWVCDGSTNIVPESGNAEAALRTHHALVTRSLQRGFYQGWDMHPCHLVTRWLATFGFFGAALESATASDEPATALALARMLLRGLDAGAFDEAEIEATAPGATVAALRTLQARRTV